MLLIIIGSDVAFTLRASQHVFQICVVLLFNKARVSIVGPTIWGYSEVLPSVGTFIKHLK